MPTGSRKRFYESGTMSEQSMGREKPERVQRPGRAGSGNAPRVQTGGAGSKRTIGLGSGLAGRAAKAIRKRHKYLQDL